MGCGMSGRPGFAYGPLREWGSLDGILIRVVGKDDTVSVHLRDGDEVHICNANREVARLLARNLLGAILRVHGEGRWESRSRPTSFVDCAAVKT